MPMLHELLDNETMSKLNYNECAIGINPNANARAGTLSDSSLGSYR